jgi:flavodoxin
VKVLVAFYSRTGNTRELARVIAGTTKAEIEEITDRTNRRGILGYLRSGSEGWFGRRIEIVRPQHDPAAFDLVIIGTPVWQVSIASPVRTYLRDHAAKLRQVAFFCTLGGMGSRYVFREMEELCGKVPLATLARTERQLASADLADAVKAFAAQLRAIPPIEAGAKMNSVQ